MNAIFDRVIREIFPGYQYSTLEKMGFQSRIWQ